MIARRAILTAAALTVLFALGGHGFGQEFPAGPISFIVSFPPGGSTDLVVRAMAKKEAFQRNSGGWMPAHVSHHISSGCHAGSNAARSCCIPMMFIRR